MGRMKNEEWIINHIWPTPGTNNSNQKLIAYECTSLFRRNMKVVEVENDNKKKAEDEL